MDQIRTVEDLIAVLRTLTDADRRDFGLWVDPSAMYQGQVQHEQTDAIIRALRAFWRLGDGSLSQDQMRALRDDAAESASWDEGIWIVGAMAESLEDDYKPGLVSLRPAFEWLLSAARRRLPSKH